MNFIKPVEDQDGNVVLNFYKISRKYVTSVWFPFDVISCLPFELFAPKNYQNMTIIKTLRLFRMTRISKILKRVVKHAKSAGAGLQVRAGRASQSRTLRRRSSSQILRCSDHAGGHAPHCYPVCVSLVGMRLGDGQRWTVVHVRYTAASLPCTRERTPRSSRRVS